MHWYNASDAQIVKQLASDAVSGLSADEAARRREKYGPNQLAEKPPTPRWKVFLSQFQDFMIYILMGAVLISAIEGHVAEAIAITIILLLNGILGYVQEYRSEKALDALKQMAAPLATVIRDGVEQQLLSSLLVPGDIVLLESGNTVPADGRLLDVGALRVVESALTGESEAVRKNADPLQGEHSILGDQTNMVFSSTTVSTGRGTFIVTATGQHTEMGKIATLLDSTKQSATPLQVELERVGKRIGIAILIIAALIFIEGLIPGSIRLLGDMSFAELLGSPEFREMIAATLLVAIALAVAAMPEGLPTIVTVSLSLGVRRMAERHAIMKRLHAVETLGSTTFICSDKTGTLTLNKMTVKRLVLGTQVICVEGSELQVLPAASVSPAKEEDVQRPTTSSSGTDFSAQASAAIDRTELETLLGVMVAASDAHYTADDQLVGDPTETALVACGRNLAPDLQLPARVAEIPFDADRKRMSVIVEDPESGYLTFVKGGFDTVLPLCTHALLGTQVVPLDDALLQQLAAENERFSKEGLRTLAYALRANSTLPADDEDIAEVESRLTYVGMSAAQDPPRPEVPAAVRTAQEAGITVAMVTGDHLLTATAIATQIGIITQAELSDGRTHTMTGVQLEKLSDAQLAEVAPDIRVYARVNPEHKIRIVSALKSRGHVVAMTGDGVNDAPALKRADIGIAMGVVGTDVTREAADMVLADDNFTTIVAAVEEGRTVFANLKKVIIYLMSSNTSEVMIVTFISMFGTFLVLNGGVEAPNLLPLQLLWINLMTDGLPALALGVDPPEIDVMKRRPRNVRKPILTKARWTQILCQGTVMSAAALLAAFVVGPWLVAVCNISVTDQAAQTRTLLFLTIIFSQLFHIFAYRSTTKSVFSAEAFKNKWLNAAFVFGALSQLAVLYVPALRDLFGLTVLGLLEWTVVLVLAFAAMTVNDFIGLYADRRLAGQE
ncbi:MAG: cation-translocating P-type ATPase [Coriobacteriia bacterium]|nr:cation-translocating P-type ATPase [Coriobacteriia bacterium]